MALRFLLPVLAMATALGLSARGAWGTDTPGEESFQAVETVAEDLPEPTGLSAGSLARPLERPPPRYPQVSRRRGQEGWVELSFSVSPDGTVTDPIVEDSSGVVEFEKAAIASALKYKYSPATWNGKPIEQCATKIHFQFNIIGQPLGARPSFAKAYQAVVDLRDEQRMTEAEAKLDEMTTNGAWNNYEASRLQLMRARLQAVKGDKAGQLRSLRRAVVDQGVFLESRVYQSVLPTIFELEVELQQYGAALETYATLKGLNSTGDVPLLDKVAGEIRDAISGPGPLEFPGVVEYRSGCAEGIPNWQHGLLRRRFGFDDVEGQIDDFELRCDWKRVVDKVSAGKFWEVPVDWGWCQIFVFGEIGAKVKLVEYPLTDTQRGIEFEPRLTK